MVPHSGNFWAAEAVLSFEESLQKRLCNRQLTDLLKLILPKGGGKCENEQKRVFYFSSICRQ